MTGFEFPPLDPPEAAGEQGAQRPLAADPFDGAGWAGADLVGRPASRAVTGGGDTPATGSDTAAAGSDAAGGGGSAAARSERTRQRVRVKRINRRRRRLIRWVLIGAGAIVVLAAGWMLYTGLAAKSQLETVRDLVHKLHTEINTGDLDAARTTADQISSHAQQAADLTSDPLWRLTSRVPWLGTPIASARTLTASINSIALSALPALVDASKAIDPKQLRQADGSIDLRPIQQVVPTLDHADQVLQQVLVRIQHLPSSSWLGAVDSARGDAIKQLTPLTKTITSADLAAQVVPTLLGASGPKHYMISFENEAELRGTGGLAGAFAIVSADHGRLSFTQFEPDDTLNAVTTGLDFGPDFNLTYDAADVTGDYRDANTSPNFPYAAQIWSAEWKKVSGQTLDGVLTLDPTALSYLLKVTGPAKLPKGSIVPTVSASNVVELTQQQAYADFGKKQKAERKTFLLSIARAASVRLMSRTGNTTGLVKAVGRAAAEGRLLFWAADPAVESRLVATSISGVTPRTSAPYAQVAINNGGGNKLDYYTYASMAWSAAGCGPTRRVTVTITVKNEAPTGLSKYVLGLTGTPGLPQQPGDNRLLISYYGTQGGELDGVLLNNDQSTAQSGRELGHPVFTVALPVPRGSTQVLVFSLTEPGRGTPLVRLQPMVNPMSATTSATC